jgi:hypothetical protein
MVLAVVNAHGLGINERFKGVGGVSKVGECQGHENPPVRGFRDVIVPGMRLSRANSPIASCVT